MCEYFTLIATMIKELLDSLFSGVWLKSLIATVLSVFTAELFGDQTVFNIWFVFVTLDFLFGYILAIKTKTVSVVRAQRWILKVGTYMALLFIVGYTHKALFLTTGESLPHISAPVNWCLCLFIVSEALSIMKLMIKLNLPVHPVLRTVVVYAEKRMTDALFELVDKWTGNPARRKKNGGKKDQGGFEL